MDISNIWLPFSIDILIYLPYRVQRTSPPDLGSPKHLRENCCWVGQPRRQVQLGFPAGTVVIPRTARPRYDAQLAFQAEKGIFPGKLKVAVPSPLDPSQTPARGKAARTRPESTKLRLETQSQWSSKYPIFLLIFPHPVPISRKISTSPWQIPG